MQSHTPKAQARRLQKLLREEHHLPLSLGQSLHLTAQSLGHKSWEALSAAQATPSVLDAPLSPEEIRALTTRHPRGLLDVTVPLHPQDLLGGNDPHLNLHELLTARISAAGGLSLLTLEAAGTLPSGAALLRVTADARDLLTATPSTTEDTPTDGWLMLRLAQTPGVDVPATLALPVTRERLRAWVNTHHVHVTDTPVQDTLETPTGLFEWRTALAVTGHGTFGWAEVVATPTGVYVQGTIKHVPDGVDGTYRTVTVPASALGQLLDVLDTEHPSYDAFSPTGSRIQAQLHHMTDVRCDVVSFSAPRADDNGFVEYGGTSDIDWDTNTPVRRQGRFVYVDEMGAEWTADQLTFRVRERE